MQLVSSKRNEIRNQKVIPCVSSLSLTYRRDLPFLFDGHADLDMAREVMDDEAASEGGCSEEKEMLLL